MNFQSVKSNTVLRITLFACLLLVISVFFIYRTNDWPYGTEAIGCLLSLILLILTLVVLRGFQKKYVSGLQEKSVSLGLYIGLLWSVEISINNFIQPELPARDYIDNSFWLLISLLILILSIRAAYQSKKFLPGLWAGLWSSLASGAVACLSALLLIVFGIKYVILDPLNIQEWSNVKATADTANIAIYFAYQSFTGAILHLYILGVLPGIILGSMGSSLGLLLNRLKH